MGLIVRKGNSDDFFKTFREMQRDIDSVFNNFLTGRKPQAGTSLMPSADVYETDDEYVFEFELPGFKKDDVKVKVEDNVLTVSSEVKEEKKEGKDKNYHIVERRYGAFKRQFSLPENVDVENIDAKFENGVLELKVQKKEEAKKGKGE
ncbi:MAG: Hsp20/alpha crystallin family protein [Thermotogota bacterium]